MQKRAPLTPDEVRLVRSRRAGGESVATIAADLGLKQDQVFDAVAGRTHRDVA